MNTTKWVGFVEHIPALSNVCRLKYQFINQSDVGSTDSDKGPVTGCCTQGSGP